MSRSRENIWIDIEDAALAIGCIINSMEDEGGFDKSVSAVNWSKGGKDESTD